MVDTPLPPEPRRCKNCKFFEPLDTVGTCRRRTPQIIHSSGSLEGHWPAVFEKDDWCGEHRWLPRP